MLSKQTKHNLSLQQILGKAGYIGCEEITNTLQGSIWRSIQKSTNKRVVIKATNIELHEKHIAVLDGREINVYENILREINILNYLSQDKQCPDSIIKYIDAFKSQTCYFLVMEDGGSSLFDFIVKIHHCIKIGILEIATWHKLAKIIFQQMIESIEYCHSKNVCHFDISLENYLINDIGIDFDGDGKMQFCIEENHVQIKLIDFGLSEFFSNGPKSEFISFQSNKYCGKENYKSPEIINKKKIFCAASNDIWGLGVCLFMMITGYAAWRKASVSDERFDMIINGQIVHVLREWNAIKCVNKDLIHLFHCFYKYEEKRIDIYSLKKCLWLNR